MTNKSIRDLVSEAKLYSGQLFEIPDSFDVREEHLYGCPKPDFIKAFKEYRDMVSSLYQDIALHPENYGFITVDKKTGEEKRSDQYFGCIYDLFAKLCRSSQLVDKSLDVDAVKFKTLCNEFPKLKSVDKLFDRLMDFGFEFEGYQNKASLNKVARLKVTNSENPNILVAIWSFSSSKYGRFISDFDCAYFNYKLFAISRNETLCLTDLYVFNLLSQDDQEFILQFNHELNKMGYGYGDGPSPGFCWGISQFAYSRTGVKTKNVICRVYQRADGIIVRLYLKNMDAYAECIESLPVHIKDSFINGHGKCNHCKDTCGHRKIFHIDGKEYQKCDGVIFEFWNPAVPDIPHYIQLLKHTLSSRN